MKPLSPLMFIKAHKTIVQFHNNDSIINHKILLVQKCGRTSYHTDAVCDMYKALKVFGLRFFFQECTGKLDNESNGFKFGI